MCTVSWLLTDAGYHVLCNRDEKRTRQVADPPRARATRAGVPYLAPLDRDHGGTWLASNAHGLTLCLLNGDTAARVLATESRGTLIPELLDCRDSTELREAIEHTRSERFAPFTLLAIAFGCNPLILEWNGTQLRHREERARHGMLSSSSRDARAARRERERILHELRVTTGHIDAAALYFFHESHGPDTALSPCMHRADAETVSFTWVEAGTDRVEMFYTPGAPCQWLSGLRTTLKLHPREQATRSGDQLKWNQSFGASRSPHC